MCALLVGLPDVTVIGVGDWPRWLRVVIETPGERPDCSCGGIVHRHGVREVELVDLPVFGRPARLVWRKQRWRCTTSGCCWCDDNAEIGAARCALTTRAARWSTLQVGRDGRAVSDVAGDLGCSWHTVMDAVVVIGEQPIDHPDRIGTVTTLGLDETLFSRVGRFRTQTWLTQIVDVRRGQLLDVVPGRSAPEPCRWLAGRDRVWLDRIEWATLDLSASYRTVFDSMLPHAIQVADPFHVTQLANRALDECRRRVQNGTCGHRGRRDDPLYRAQRRLTIARDRLSDDQHGRVLGLLRAGDSRQEVWFAWNAKEVVRRIDDHADPELSDAWVDAIGWDFTDWTMPPEVRRLGWHHREVGRSDLCMAWLPCLQRADRGRQQPGQAHQASRVRARQLPTPPSPLPALCRQARLGPATHRPTLKRREPCHKGAVIAPAASSRRITRAGTEGTGTQRTPWRLAISS